MVDVHGSLRLLLKSSEEFRAAYESEMSVLAPGALQQSDEPSFCCTIRRGEISVLTLFSLPKSVEKGSEEDKPLLSLNKAQTLEEISEQYLKPSLQTFNVVDYKDDLNYVLISRGKITVLNSKFEEIETDLSDFRLVSVAEEKFEEYLFAIDAKNNLRILSL